MMLHGILHLMFVASVFAFAKLLFYVYVKCRLVFRMYAALELFCCFQSSYICKYSDNHDFV